MVLLRDGASSSRPRTLLTHDMIGRALASNGIKCYRNVTLVPRFPWQVRLFNRAGLIISPHGSQLKNAGYMGPNSIVLELQTDEGTNMRAPFARGPDRSDMLFVQRVHGYDPSCTFADNLRACNVSVNEKMLVQDLKDALSRQHEACGDIWQQQIC